MSSHIQINRICQHCGKEFIARTTTTSYCSHKCNSSAYKAKTRKAKIEKSNEQVQLVKSKPVEDLKSKAFLSIADTSKLLGISRRTIYRMIERGEMIIAKAGRRSILRRSDIDNLFNNPITMISKIKDTQTEYDISDCYNMQEIQDKFGVSGKALYEIIKRNNIPKLPKGKFVYVPKVMIDKILN